MGFHIIEEVYSSMEVTQIISLIDSEVTPNQFGIREFLIDKPNLCKKIFNTKLLQVIKHVSPNCKKAIKSIYFDKPPSVNWNVNWHQDLTINLTNRKEVDYYKNWRKKDQRYVVQPNKEFLENIFTIRIHLDDCSETNGALRVIENSHLNGVVSIKEWIKGKKGIEKICEVKKGGILLIKPLLLHSSKRAENEINRRVIHIEFTDKELPDGLMWKEKVEFESLPDNN